MVGRKKGANKRRAKRTTGKRLRRYRGSASVAVTTASSLVSFMRVVRTILAALPLVTGANSSITSLIGIFDVSFNFIKSVMGGVDYYNGAYAMFLIRAGSLMMNSPLMAGNATNLSFPGYPISVRWLRLRLRNTSSNAERAGRWAAVFIPFREMHDPTHYEKVLKNGVTFEEVSSMPYARVSDARVDLNINFAMRDKTMYCARPRELTEGLGVVIVCWDTGSRDDFSKHVTNSMFNCEIELEAGCIPHPIFGPRHRVTFVAKEIDISSITDGTSVLVNNLDTGTRQLVRNDLTTDFEYLSV